MFRKSGLKGDRWPINGCFLDFSIIIDSDRGHCCEHLKKISLRWKLSPWHVFECLGMRWILSCQKWQKVQFGIFQARPASFRVISYFVCKSSFRVISMTKIAILDQMKPISLIFKNKKTKIKKSKICKLHVYYSYKRKFDKYTTNGKIKFYIFYVQ